MNFELKTMDWLVKRCYGTLLRNRPENWKLVSVEKKYPKERKNRQTICVPNIDTKKFKGTYFIFKEVKNE